MVTSKRSHALAAALAAVSLFASAPAAAEQPGLEDDRVPTAPIAPALAPAAHHSPVASARAGVPLTLNVTLEGAHLLKMAYVVYRSGDKWFTLKLLRSDSGYAGTIPAEHVKPIGLAYALELETLEGARIPAFASRAAPQLVAVHEDRTDARELALLDRVFGRRSVVAATGEFVRFGETTSRQTMVCAAGQTVCNEGDVVRPTVDDQYWRVEGSYTYRPLRTVSEFGFRAGVVRGRSLVQTGTFDAKKFEVGLNYAGANVRFRLADIFHLDFELLGSVTEIGFSTGGGASALIGDPLGTRFTLGWQTIGFTSDTYFGTRFYTRLDIPMSDRVTLAPSVEVTDMPHADRFGVRLLADVNIAIARGFGLGLRGGYQAREFTSGGPSAGATLQLGF